MPNRSTSSITAGQRPCPSSGTPQVAARSGVIPAFDELAGALRTRCLVTFPAPRVLPVAAVVRADTPQGPVTADAVVPRPAAAPGAAGAQGSGAGRTVGAVVAVVVGLVMLAAVVMLGWGAVQSARWRPEGEPDAPG